MSSANRQPIPNTGSLKDRIARLNLQNPTSPSSPSSSTQDAASGSTSSPPSPTAVRTGATTRISDKISRFQANAEESALLPVGGSFGLAPARPSSSSREKGNRVASLGAGRASVPLNVVKPTRSVSAGNVGSRTASENGSVGSVKGETTAASVGSGGDVDSRPGTPSGSRTGSTYETSSTLSTDVASASTDATGSLLDSQHFSNLLTPGPRTPGAQSVSSMNVETGSIASEGDHTPSLAPSDIAEPSEIPSFDTRPRDSPRDLPTIDPSVASSDDFPPTPPALPAKGPLDHLRQPSRSASVASMSSLVVEAPLDDTADLDAISGRPSVASDSESRANITPTPTDDGNEEEEEEGDEKRLERTNEELTRYEADEQDPTAHGPGPEDGEGALPVRPTWKAEENEGDMPKAKCSDCDQDVALVELADHTCASSGQPPSLRSPPASPSNHQTALRDPSPTHDAVEDVSPTPLAGSAVLEPVTDDSTVPTRSSEPRRETSEKLDEYVPQTQSVVPEDMGEDDVLDFYGDEPAVATEEAKIIHPVDADVPRDLEDEDEDEADHRESGSTAAAMSRSHSQPTTRAPKEPSGPRSHSVYLPGHYDETDEDEGYQGGTATIVRSSR